MRKTLLAAEKALAFPLSKGNGESKLNRVCFHFQRIQRPLGQEQGHRKGAWKRVEEATEASRRETLAAESRW